MLAHFPLLLARDEWERLAHWAEALSAEALAAERELLFRGDLHARLGLPRKIRKALWNQKEQEISPGAARVMRFDFHFTTQGWRISEVNADVPGGFIEASGFTQLMAAHYPETTIPPDPSQLYAEAIRSETHAGALVALVHATAYTDDRQVMEFVGRHLKSSGLQPCMVGPDHIRWESNRAQISCRFASGWPDVLVRFFPAEWLPSLDNRSAWWGYFRGGHTPVSNPGAALLIQSKRFPLTWDSLATPVPTWRQIMPETRSLDSVPKLSPDDWVLKPALGRVGDGIGIRGITQKREWELIKKDLRLHPSAWVAQKRFDAVPVEVEGEPYYPCLGIFTIGGRAAGIYGRIAKKPLIDGDAQDVAVLIDETDGSAC